MKFRRCASLVITTAVEGSKVANHSSKVVDATADDFVLAAINCVEPIPQSTD